MMKRISAFLIFALVGAILAACGAPAPAQPTPVPAQPTPVPEQPTPAPAGMTGTIKIATQSPLSGPQAALGVGLRNGAELGLEQLGKTLTDMGFTVELAPFDDQAKPEVGSANAKNIISDNDLPGAGIGQPYRRSGRRMRCSILNTQRRLNRLTAFDAETRLAGGRSAPQHAQKRKRGCSLLFIPLLYAVQEHD